MPLPAVLIPLLQPVATYFGITGAGPAATALAASIAKAAELGLLYIGGGVLMDKCREFTTEVDLHCKDAPISDVYCVAMKVNQVTTCTGGTIATGALVFDTASRGIELIKSKLFFWRN